MKNNNDVFEMNLMSALKELLKYWYLIAAFLGLTVVLGVLYLKYASKSHKVGSSILLRIENDNKFAAGSNDILRAFDFMLQDKTFRNEVFFLQSYPLIREVVNEMDMRISYYVQEDKIPKRFSFTINNIYKDSPILVIPADDHILPTGVLFYVKILDNERFHISAENPEATIIDPRTDRTVRGGVNFQMGGIYNFGTLIEHDFASFRILLNPNYQPDQFLNKDLFFKFNNLAQLAGTFKGALAVEAQGIESTMAQLSFTTDNDRLGIDFLNALINKYIEKRLDDANSLANKTIEHIDRQLVDVTEDLTESERRLQDIKSSYNIMNVDEKAQNLQFQLQAYELQRNEAQRRLSHLEQLTDYFAGQGGSARVIAPSSLGLVDPLLTNLIQELTNLNSERQRMVDMDQLRSPRFMTLEKSIDNLKSVISENLDFSLDGTKREITDLNVKINRLASEFSALPYTQRQMLGIERKFNLNDAIYTSLLERRIQAQIVKAAKLPDAEVIEPPFYIGVASPKSIVVLVLSVFLGLAIPGLFILIKVIIANKIVSREDVKLITSIPVISTIPSNNRVLPNVVMNYPRSPIAEAFHILRSNLVYYVHGEHNNVILITSSIPGEGKSFTAMNLATSFALANSKTILVEFDLRNPSRFVEFFDINEPTGLSSYLINRATLDEIIIPTKGFSLDIIQAGKIPPNPVELISSDKTTELFNELKTRYDYIIVDAPPYGLVTDSFLLMNHSNLNLFVTRAGYTKKTVLASNMEDVESKKINNLYLLLNDDKEDKMGYDKYTYEEKKTKAKLPYLPKKKVAAL